jgi:hypothetical protein
MTHPYYIQPSRYCQIYNKKLLASTIRAIRPGSAAIGTPVFASPAARVRCVTAGVFFQQIIAVCY